MALSTLTHYGGDIAERSAATPGLWNRRLSVLSQNIDQINSDHSTSLTSAQNIVSIVAGTANQVAVSAATGAVTLSLPSTVMVSQVSVVGSIAQTSSSSTALVGNLAYNGTIIGDVQIGRTSTSPWFYPSVTFHSNRSTVGSPVVGSVEFWGHNSSDAVKRYAHIRSQLSIPTAGSEVGSFDFWAYNAGVEQSIAVLGPGLQVGVPTGGDLGSGTVNVSGGVYKNNVAYVAGDVVVASLASTANQVTVSAATGAVTISLANPLTPPGPIKLADGTYLAPSLTFSSNASGGLYYDASTARWVQAGTTAAILPLVAGALTLGRVDYGAYLQGPISSDTLTLNKEPSSASHAASKNYVDNKVSTYTGAVAASISAASVTDGSFPGEYQFSRATSALTIAGDVTGQQQYVANTVGPIYPAFVGSQRSFGFGFSAANNYPMVTMSGVTQALWDSTSLNITSDISMVNTSKRVRLQVGSAIAPSIVIGSNESTGFYFNSSGNVLNATVEGQQGLSVQSTSGKILVIIGASGANDNEVALVGASNSTRAFTLGGTLASGTSRAIVYHNGLAANLSIDIQKGVSVTSTFLKLEHSSTASHTGLYLYDPSSPSMTPVVVLPNDTGATGFRALAVPNV